MQWGQINLQPIDKNSPVSDLGGSLPLLRTQQLKEHMKPPLASSLHTETALACSSACMGSQVTSILSACKFYLLQSRPLWQSALQTALQPAK